MWFHESKCPVSLGRMASLAGAFNGRSRLKPLLVRITSSLFPPSLLALLQSNFPLAQSVRRPGSSQTDTYKLCSFPLLLLLLPQHYQLLLALGCSDGMGWGWLLYARRSRSLLPLDRSSDRVYLDRVRHARQPAFSEKLLQIRRGCLQTT